jgi:hypothetical protein
MSIQSHTDKPQKSFLRWLEEPAPLSGAIIGGAIGAFTGNLIGTIGGMALGALAADAITRYVGEPSKATSNDKMPAS